MNESSPPDLDILMQRIRAELHQANAGSAAGGTAAPGAPSDTRRVDTAQRRYRFAEFRRLDNESFVRNAYLAALGREPDEIGRLTSLHRLESGQIGRVSLLLELANSPEGRRRGITITGLGLHPALEKLRYNHFTRMVPTVARLIRNTPRIVNHVRQLAAQAGTAERLALQAVACAESAQRIAQSGVDTQRAELLAEIDSRMLRQRASLEEMTRAHLDRVAVQHAIEQHTSTIRTETEQRIANLETALRAVAPLDAVEQLSADLTRAQAELQRKLADHWRATVDQKLRLEMLLAEVRRRMPEPLSREQIARVADEEDHLLDAFYVSFEDRYRGTRADIKNRQRTYLPEVARAVAAAGGAPVMDVGCGRGEWLELLQENGFAAQGCDLNRIMVQESRDRGLDVTLGDALEALAAMPDNSRAAVTGFHIIEHLPFANVIRLFDQALRVLRPGGVALFETPNPGNLLVASEAFYLDPTHRNPLPAELMVFAAEMRGFTAVESRFLHPPAGPIPDAPDSPLLDLLRTRIYAPRDYAVIGWKTR